MKGLFFKMMEFGIDIILKYGPKKQKIRDDLIRFKKRYNKEGRQSSTMFKRYKGVKDEFRKRGGDRNKRD